MANQNNLQPWCRAAGLLAREGNGLNPDSRERVAILICHFPKDDTWLALGFANFRLGELRLPKFYILRRVRRLEEHGVSEKRTAQRIASASKLLQTFRQAKQ